MMQGPGESGRKQLTNYSNYRMQNVYNLLLGHHAGLLLPHTNFI